MTAPSAHEQQAALAGQFRFEIAHRYDKRTTSWLYRPLKCFMRLFFLSDIVVEGIPNLAGVPRGVPVILSSIHKSHLDYLLMGLAIYGALRTVPAIIGGKNLFHGLFKHLLPRLKGICLDRDRANPKNLRSRENLLYLSTFYDYLMEVLEQGDMILIYPEAGRSYSGAIQPLSLGVFGIAKRALKEGHPAVAIVPAGITYDRVTEDDRFQRMDEYKSKGAQEYRAYDKGAFMRQALLQPKGAVYIDFGAPLMVSDVRAMDQLELELRTRMGALARVTPVALVSRALCGHATRPLADVLSHIGADLDCIRQRSLPAGRDVLNREAAAVFNRALPHLCRRLRLRDIIRIEGAGPAATIRACRSDVLQYYANTVSHLFDGPTA